MVHLSAVFQAERVMGTWKWSDLIDAKAVITKVVAGLITSAIVSCALMLWSYLQGYSGPVIVVIGLYGFGALLWIYRQFILPWGVHIPTVDEYAELRRLLLRHADAVRKDGATAVKGAATVVSLAIGQEGESDYWARVNSQKDAKDAASMAAVYLESIAAKRVIEPPRRPGW